MRRDKNRIIVSSLIGLLFVSTTILGQQPEKQTSSQESVTIAAAEVVVDVIVTDKKDQIVTDLTPADFEISENGDKQEIRSARFERLGYESDGSGSDTDASTAGGAPSTAVVARQPNLMALVFDNLSMARGSQVYAMRAARDYLDKLAPNDWVAVFGVDTRLFLVQSFTRDKELLKHAVEVATSGTSRQFASGSDAIAQILQSGIGEGQTAEQRLAAAETYVPSPNEGNIAQVIDAVLLNTFRAFERLEQEAQARAMILGLLSIVRGMQQLPGRKTAILFSEGVSIPSTVTTQFKSVIGNANRANVAFYTIDAGGLRADSETARTGRELSVLAEARSRGADPTLVQGGESMLGRAESLARSNRQDVLAELADETGGLAIRNTNDLRAGLDRFDEDMRGYYLLTYAPHDQNFDGRFRRISVKVIRPGLHVRARSGYYALRTVDSAPILPHEEPLFELIHQAKKPADFALKVASMQFPMAPPRMVNSLQVVVEVPGDIIDFEEIKSSDKKKKDEAKNYMGQVAIMALVKDAQGMVVRKLSQNYTLMAREDRLEAIKKNRLVFYRNTDVEPGQYTIEAVARDAESGKASVSQTTATVPQAASAPLRLSSIVPANGAEPLSAGQYSSNNPFHYGNVAIMPNLEKTYKKSADQKLMFYFTTQTVPSASVNVKIEFMQSGQVLAQSSGALPAPDQYGRIQFVAEFPTGPFPPGTYNVRMTVSDGTNQATEQTPFTIVQ